MGSNPNKIQRWSKELNGQKSRNSNPEMEAQCTSVQGRGTWTRIQKRDWDSIQRQRSRDGMMSSIDRSPGTAVQGLKLNGQGFRQGIHGQESRIGDRI